MGRRVVACFRMRNVTLAFITDPRGTCIELNEGLGTIR